MKAITAQKIMKKHLKTIKALIIVFYLVGVVGMLLPQTFPFFLNLIPLALGLSFVTLACFHEGKVTRNTYLAFSIIYLFSFLIEAIGVTTGLIFGHYTYDQSLGLKVFRTPIIIGVNWLFLVYTTASMVDHFNISKWAKIILASSGMVGYDLLMEQIAPTLNMWHWKDDIVPIQNYLAWFVFAVLFHFLLKTMKIKTSNALSLMLFVCQFLFFLMLFISFKLLR